jgi:thiamine kinase-like enzyme
MRVESEIDDVIDDVPELRGRTRSVGILPGGLTNTNYRVDAEGGSYVVRRWSSSAGLLDIDRDAEHHNTVAAAEAGVGAPVVAYLPERRALVLRFIEGRTLSAADLREPGRLEQVAAVCRALHGGRRFVGEFDMFDVQRRYLGVVDARGFRLPDGYRSYAPTVEAMRAAMAVRGVRSVPCHNDLLAENFIDDGERLWLVDYEYSGNADPTWEIGNIWSESNLSLAQLEELVACYYGEPRPSRVARARLWAIMSKYGWMLWAAIQDGSSALDFDFWSWGMEKYERAVAELESSELERLIHEVQEED